MMRPCDLNILAGVLCCFLFASNLPAETPAETSKKRPSVVSEQADPTPEPSAVSPLKNDGDSRKSTAAPDATILSGQIVEFGGEPPRVKKLIESALALTALNLTYTYNSDDPANGGMDCSGFTFYLLGANGFADVPRDSSGQYAWVRKAGAFRAVLSQNPDTFELDDLRPGDLLFWTGTYATHHDPPVTHVMIYLGTEKGTGNRIMAGSSDGRSYHGKSRWGVSVFDFQLSGHPRAPADKPAASVFVGYASPPGLRD